MDFSQKFLEICANKQEVFATNNFNIPIKTNSLDHCISAVIHHLATRKIVFSV